MSYDVALLCGCCGSAVKVERHEEGGTYALGGTDKATLNVTYNYSKHFDFRALDGKTALQTIKPMGIRVRELGTHRDPDYWNPTPGNVGYALSVLLLWATRYPLAVWRVD